MSDKRKNNRRPFKWGEKKTERVSFRLTKKAKDWLESAGGADAIEELAQLVKEVLSEMDKDELKKLLIECLSDFYTEKLEQLEYEDS